MPTTTVEDLNVIAVLAADIDRMEAFYCRHLGFARAGVMNPGVLLRAGGVTLYLEACSDRSGDGDSRAGFMPCFATGSVRGSYDSLKAAGVPIADEYTECSPTFALFRIRDPEGNLVEFAGRP